MDYSSQEKWAMEGRPNRLEPKVLKMRKKQVRKRCLREGASEVCEERWKSSDDGLFEEGIPVQLKVILQVCESRAIHSCSL
ncbi:hypothetical protein [Rubritalea tangerina]|uniref:hypothetical protein n=1 Tax=Rubritalea tangerina TaxID=430798 RepID=UPI00360A6B9D